MQFPAEEWVFIIIIVFAKDIFLQSEPAYKAGQILSQLETFYSWWFRAKRQPVGEDKNFQWRQFVTGYIYYCIATFLFWGARTTLYTWSFTAFRPFLLSFCNIIVSIEVWDGRAQYGIVEEMLIKTQQSPAWEIMSEKHNQLRQFLSL